MSKLEFSDGMKFNTSGPLRLTHRSDGFYVVGEGKLIPVATVGEGKEIIEELEARPENRPGHSQR